MKIQKEAVIMHKKSLMWVMAILAVCILLPGYGFSGGDNDGKGNWEKRPELRVLSSDPNWVTGGDALIEVLIPGGVSARAIKVTLNGKDVTSQLTFDAATDTLRGLISGMVVGKNRLTAGISHGHETTLTLTNYPIGGPVFTGPQLQPWLCSTKEAGLGDPVDAQCNAPARYDYFYMSNATGKFQTYDPNNPPAATDIATTTTDQGVTMNYIVRRETGALNRSIYQIAVLFDLAKPWTALKPQKGWNHKLYVPTTGGFEHNYVQNVISTLAPAPMFTVLDEMSLKRGFMVAVDTFWQPFTDMEPVRGAESIMMLKELIAKQYGLIRYTFTAGCSGGAIAMDQVANSYPALFQGVVPLCEYVDYWGSCDQEVLDCDVLVNYMTTTSPTLWSDPSQRNAVYGYLDEVICKMWAAAFPVALNPTNSGPVGTDLGPALTYNPTTNPAGARSTHQDYEVNYLGRREPSSWTPQEKAAGFGFARSVRDNVGVQYGLHALLEGKISPEQFVDMNEKVGGVDIDLNRVPTRTVQDPGIGHVMYRTGGVSDARNLDKVAMICARSPDVDPFSPNHSMVHSWILLDRLKKMTGTTNNHVLWIIPGFNGFVDNELWFLNMDRWLAAIEADKSSDPLEVKVIKDKPTDLADGCWAPGTTNITLSNEVRDLNYCTSTWYPVSGTPRIAATPNFSRWATFVTKCQLKPLVRSDYYPVVFTDAQWALLKATFPTGVCDWRKPDAALTLSMPWLTFKDGPGGKPMCFSPKSPGYYGDAENYICGEEEHPHDFDHD